MRVAYDRGDGKIHVTAVTGKFRAPRVKILRQARDDTEQSPYLGLRKPPCEKSPLPGDSGNG
jgi:hypothetical protein